MASIITHSLVGLSVALLLPKEKRTSALLIAATIAPSLPDLDGIGFHLGVPYDSFWGHRGFFHSFLFSVLLGSVIAGLIQKRTKYPFLWLSVFFSCLISTHGLLDAMTTGGLGVALFSPFDNDRIFLPWRIIKVSPMSISRFFSSWGWRVLESEILYVWLPLGALLVANRWRKRRFS